MHPSPSDVSESGGTLNLVLASDGNGATNGVGAQVRSTSFSLPVGGFLEFRADVPGPGSSPGTSIYDWPTVWASGPDWPVNGEEDVLEGLGSATSNYHYGPSSDDQDTPINSPTIAGDWSNSYHTYGVYRGPSSCTIYYDGSKVDSYQTHDQGSAQPIVMTQGAPAGPDATIDAPLATGAASTLRIDYVRAWVPAS